MLTIILGIVLIIILVFIAAKVCQSERAVTFFSLVSTIVLLGAIGIGIFVPVSGYNEWELIKETKLVSLSNNVISGGTGIVYVSLSADNVYTYRYEINSDFGTETSREYQIQTLVDDNVEEIEDPNCKTPVIRVYERTGKKSFWTFALSLETKYIFYVPEGSISKEINLS